jgi:D-alanyl-lipoteichoic acid acyltransferase DltB (MBOAT superfamily)
MLFNSFSFLLFFIIIYALFWAMPTWPQKKYLLLIASYLFYAAWNPPYSLILLASTLLDWWLARLVGRSESRQKRRLLLLGSLICNLGLLGYFKYGNFLLENFVAWPAMLGITLHPMTADIILPIGISFYTFASLSYTIDVYRQKIRSDWKFIDYALFVSFFPHLVAGPIVRASFLLPQIENPRLPTFNQVGWGFALVCFGLFSKVVMADSIFKPMVDTVYAHAERYNFVDTWIAVLSFSGQIFYDFSGYSLCAIGLAMCFGFRFPDTFRYPYAATSFSDFWRRWHISLSAWLRDYLYIPLGGNRHGVQRTYIALLITMLLGGLWHGASWMFVLWGGLHGFYLVAEKYIRDMPLSHFFPMWGRSPFVFLIVTLTWIPFRAATPIQTLSVLRGLANISEAVTIEWPALVALIAILLTLRWHFVMKNARIEDFLHKSGRVAQIGVTAISLVGLFLCSGSDNKNAFIYFQF